MTVRIEIEDIDTETVQAQMARLLAGAPRWTREVYDRLVSAQQDAGTPTEPPAAPADVSGAQPQANAETKRRGPGRPKKDAVPPLAADAPPPADGAGVSVSEDPSTTSASSPAAGSTDAPTTGGVTIADPANPTIEDCRAALARLCAAKDAPTGKALLERFVPAGQKTQVSNVPAERYAEFIAACA